MAYLSIQDFKYGMDRRRERVAGTPGTLWTLENAHITRGGDIERCRKFVTAYSLLAGTVGMFGLNKQLYVFGSAANPGVPVGVAYQRLQSPNSGTLLEIVDVCGFAGNVYAIADFSDGGRFHFYNGARVTDWDTVAAASASFTALAQLLADKINANSAVTAVATGNVITVTARVPGVAFSISGTTVNGGGANDQTITIATPQANVPATSTTAGIAQVSTATLGGTFETADQFTITVNGVSYVATGLASGMGCSCNVFFKRVWSPAGSLWRYCKLTDATVWDPAAPGSDAGFINVAVDVSGNQNVIGAERYQNQVAVYSEDVIVLYNLDTDPANFSQSTVLDNTSTDALHSIFRYGNNDVFHLDPTGVRSLRALNASNAPFVSDVGNAIDTFLLAYLDTLPVKQARAARATIEPRDGRFWLAAGNRIIVLSFFPGAKISAWSYYSPGFTASAFARIGKRLYVRGGDTIYLYGGLDGQTYPGDNELVPMVELPFLSANSPATKKGLDGFDAATTNEWEVHILLDPNNEGKSVKVGKIVDRTYGLEDIVVPGQAPLVAVKMFCTRGGRATISMAQIHFTKQDEG